MSDSNSIKASTINSRIEKIEPQLLAIVLLIPQTFYEISNFLFLAGDSLLLTLAPNDKIIISVMLIAEILSGASLYLSRKSFLKQKGLHKLLPLFIEFIALVYFLWTGF